MVKYTKRNSTVTNQPQKIVYYIVIIISHAVRMMNCEQLAQCDQSKASIAMRYLHMWYMNIIFENADVWKRARFLHLSAQTLRTCPQLRKCKVTKLSYEEKLWPSFPHLFSWRYICQEWSLGWLRWNYYLSINILNLYQSSRCLRSSFRASVWDLLNLCTTVQQ